MHLVLYTLPDLLPSESETASALMTRRPRSVKSDQRWIMSIDAIFAWADNSCVVFLLYTVY